MKTDVRRIFAFLQEGILQGKFDEDKPLPSLRVLMARYGAPLHTVRSAVDELIRRGLAESRHGSGTYVTKRGMARKIGLVIPGLAYSDFFRPFADRIIQLCAKGGYKPILKDDYSRQPRKRAKEVLSFVKELIGEKVAGVVFQPLEHFPSAGYANAKIAEALDDAGIPLVLVDSDIVPPPKRSRYDVIGINNFDAGFRLAAHLSEVGARRICFLKKKGERSVSCIDRIHGIQSFLGTRRFSTDRNVLETAADDSRAIGRYLRQRRPDAFICGNDALAATFRQTLEKLGISVPGDLLLAGFDDVNIARLTQLTSVRQPCESIARAAFGRLLERLADPRLDPAEILLAAPLAVRMSTNFVQPGS